MFPAYKSANDDTAPKSGGQLDWLSNKSFKPSAFPVDADLFHHDTGPPEAGTSPNAESIEIDASSTDESLLQVRQCIKQGGEREDVGKEQAKKRRHKHKHKSAEKHKKHKHSEKDKDSKTKADCASVCDPCEYVIDPSANFQIDRRSDEYNLIYGSIYRKNVPRYWRKGDSCLGLTGNQTIWFMERKKLKKGCDSAGDRYFAKENRVLSSAAGESLAASQHENLLASDSSYISIKDPASHAHTDLGQGAVDLGRVREEVNPDWFRRDWRTADYNRRLRDDETNVGLWLEFINYQSEYSASHEMDASVDEGKRSGNVQSATWNKVALLKEIKMCIAEKALLKNQQSVALRLAQLDLAEGVWEHARLADAWKGLVFTRANDPTVWRRYLRFVCRHFHGFTVARVSGVHARALSTLRAVVEGTLLSHQSVSPHTLCHMIDILHELCVMLYQAGHIEKSIAIYQAMLELNLFPLSPLSSLSAGLDLLGSFWDSNRPGLGEIGALGLGRWAADRDSERNVPEEALWASKDEDETVEQRLLDDLTNAPRPSTWIALETSRAARHWLPWRPEPGGDDADCEDVERLVLFDDVSPYLFLVPTDDHRHMLLVNFLRLLLHSLDGAVRPESLNRGHRSPGGDECLLCDDVTQVFTSADGATLFKKSMLADERGRPENRERFIENVFVRTMPLFSGHPLTSLTLMYAEFKVNRSLHGRRLASGIQAGYGSDTLKKVVLDMQWNQENEVKLSESNDVKRGVGRSTTQSADFKKQAKELRQSLKALLSQEANRNNIAIWDMYARFEWRSGNEKEARRVLDAALRLHSGGRVSDYTDRYQQCVTLKLYRTYASLLLGMFEFETCGDKRRVNGDKSTSLSVLVSLVDGSSVIVNAGALSSTQLLKSLRQYEQFLDALVHRFTDMDAAQIIDAMRYFSFAGDQLVHMATCFALFQYLTGGIATASRVFDDLMDRLRPHIPPRNLLEDQHEYSLLDPSLAESDKSTSNLSTTSVSHYRRSVFLLLRESHISLLHFHMERENAPLRVLRDPLMASLDEAVTPLRLRLLLDLEEGSRVTGRLNRFFSDRINSRSSKPHRNGRSGSGESKDGDGSGQGSGLGGRVGGGWEDGDRLLVCLYAALAQFRRMRRLRDGSSGDMQETGITHQLRAWLETAVHLSSVQHSVLVWRLYIHFEAGLGNTDRVKALFYRSLQNCPWAKSLYLDTVAYVPDSLQEVSDLITEKELRLRTPLEELDLLLASSKAGQTVTTDASDRVNN